MRSESWDVTLRTVSDRILPGASHALDANNLRTGADRAAASAGACQTIAKRVVLAAKGRPKLPAGPDTRSVLAPRLPGSGP